MQDHSEQHLRNSYDVFASAYDRFFAPEALDTTVQVLSTVLFSQLPSGSEVLDLCCGTGRLTEVLVHRGYRVTAIDNSTQMLERARTRVPVAAFLKSDIQEFELQSSFDAVICAYNSVPHVTNGGELIRVFECVRRSLRPDGVFVFDLYSRSAYAERWRGTFARVDDDCACVVQAHYDPGKARGENLITIFRRDGDWKRTDLRLTTRCYADEELRHMLAAAGFQNVQKFDDNDQLGTDIAGRVFWRCKPA
jgi:SAM-dependent methyltransferase